MIHKTYKFYAYINYICLQVVVFMFCGTWNEIEISSFYGWLIVRSAREWATKKVIWRTAPRLKIRLSGKIHWYKLLLIFSHALIFCYLSPCIGKETLTPIHISSAHSSCIDFVSILEYFQSIQRCRQNAEYSDLNCSWAHSTFRTSSIPRQYYWSGMRGLLKIYFGKWLQTMW